MIYSERTISEGKNIHTFTLRSLRIICLFAIVVNLFYILYGIVIDIPEISIICAAFTLGGIVSLVMTYFNQEVAKVLIITSTAISLMVTFHTFTIGYTILTIFFPVLLAHLFIFNFDADKKPFFTSLTITLLTIVFSIFLPRFQFLKVTLPEAIANQTDNIHGLVSLAVTTFLLIVIILNKTKVNRLLEEKKKDLKSALRELTETQDQLIQTEKMASLGLLTAGINHEINNPLNFMSGGLENLKNITEKNKLEDIKPYLYVFDEGIKRIEDIVSGLNHFNYRSTSFENKCEVNNIINNCLKVLSHELKDRITIKKNYEDNLVITGNSGQLHQVFLNIIANASQAIENEGAIEIITMSHTDHASIKISDSGPGIPDELKRKIFDPFFTTKEPGIGTGLGLSVSFSIIKKHQGEIKVDSKINSGTTFTITFPINNRVGYSKHLA